MASEKIHVMPHPDGGWQIKREGSNKATGKFKTKKEAMARAKELSGNSDSHVVEHGTDGTIKGVSKSAQVEKADKDMTNVAIHIVPNPNGGWQVKREGSNKSIGNYSNKEEAMARARKLSGNSDSQIIEHAMDGSIKSVSKSKQAKKPAAKKEAKPTEAKPAAKKPAVKKETNPAVKKTCAKKPCAKKADGKKRQDEEDVKVVEKPRKGKVMVVRSGLVIDRSKADDKEIIRASDGTIIVRKRKK